MPIIDGEKFLSLSRAEQEALVFGFMEGFVLAEDMARERAKLDMLFLDRLNKKKLNATAITESVLRNIKTNANLRSQPFSYGILVEVMS